MDEMEQIAETKRVEVRYTVHVELVHPISYGPTHKQTWADIRVESYDDMRLLDDNTVLRVFDVWDGKHHYFPLQNIVTWNITPYHGD
jgi:hypothetical protein